MNLIEYHKFLFLDDVDPYTSEELQNTIYYFNSCIWDDVISLNTNITFNIKILT